MRESIKTGLGFGITSGIITTLGLIIGLNKATGLKLAVISGILTIAIADAFSDAFGIYTSEESKKRNGSRAIHEAAAITFFAKFFVATSFIVPVILFDLNKAVKLDILWGLGLMTIFSYFLAKKSNKNPLKLIASHLTIAGIVIIITFYVGKLISIAFV